MFCIALLVGSGCSTLLAQQQPPPHLPRLPPTTAPQDEFVPVKDLPAEDRLPAAPLLVAAYAAAWVAIIVYVWSLWRRLARVEHEIAALRRRVDPGAKG